MKRKISVWAKRLFVFIVILSSVVVICDFAKKKSSEYSFGNALSAHIPKIKIVNPETHDLVNSPLLVKGEAAKAWFEGGNLVILLLDEKGNEIARKLISLEDSEAHGDLYAFETKLQFEEGQKGQGQLVFTRQKKVNDAFPVSFQLPVAFE